MDASQLISFYTLTQGEIDKLWEFFLISHLAIIGWLISVKEQNLIRVRTIIVVAYVVMFGGLFVFFNDAYNDMILIQLDLRAALKVSELNIVAGGYVDQLLTTDISSRLNRVSIFFVAASICTLFLLFHPTLLRRKTTVDTET